MGVKPQIPVFHLGHYRGGNARLVGGRHRDELDVLHVLGHRQLHGVVGVRQGGHGRFLAAAVEQQGNIHRHPLDVLGVVQAELGHVGNGGAYLRIGHLDGGRPHLHHENPVAVPYDVLIGRLGQQEPGFAQKIVFFQLERIHHTGVKGGVEHDIVPFHARGARPRDGGVGLGRGRGARRGRGGLFGDGPGRGGRLIPGGAVPGGTRRGALGRAQRPGGRPVNHPVGAGEPPGRAGHHAAVRRHVEGGHALAVGVHGHQGGVPHGQGDGHPRHRLSPKIGDRGGDFVVHHRHIHVGVHLAGAHELLHRQRHRLVAGGEHIGQLVGPVRDVDERGRQVAPQALRPVAHAVHQNPVDGPAARFLLVPPDIKTSRVPVKRPLILHKSEPEQLLRRVFQGLAAPGRCVGHIPHRLLIAGHHDFRVPHRDGVVEHHLGFLLHGLGFLFHAVHRQLEAEPFWRLSVLVLDRGHHRRLVQHADHDGHLAVRRRRAGFGGGACGGGRLIPQGRQRQQAENQQDTQYPRT